jgi:PadR family transcriptional regulator, regulatory protein AphA
MTSAIPGGLDGVLLGLLRTPSTGYQVKQSFDSIFSHIWAAELSQIYRTLRRLEDEGCLRSRSEASDKGPERRKYEITAKGRKRLHAWLASGPQVGDERHAHVAQLFFMGELHDFRATGAFLETLLRQYRARLAAMRAMEQAWRTADPGYPDRLDPEGFHCALTLQMGIQRVEALECWADDSLRRVNKRQAEGK